MFLQIAKQLVVALLTLESRAVVAKYHPKIIAVTGSLGKTATKDAIYAMLMRGARVRKSEKSFNSEVGLPLTILGVPNAWNNPLRWLLNLVDGLLLIIFPSRYPEWLVLEVGADRPGDIKKVASWLPVDIAVITRLPEVPVHVEFFDSPEEVVQEKAALIGALKPQGTLILFGDDERTKTLASRAKGSVLTFGFSDAVDVRIEKAELVSEEGREHWPLGMKAILHCGGVSAPIFMIGAVGAHTLLPQVVAAAVGHVLGKSSIEILEGLKSYEPPPGRMRLIRGLKDSLVIDDTYNSSPAAVVAALDTLDLIGRAAQERGITPARQIAVLGDMLELGRHSKAEHRKVGAHAAQTATLLVTVGFRARDIAEGALDAGMPELQILQFEDAQKAGAELENIIAAGDCVLVKGSQSVRMERVVEEIMAEPERAAELLVRQDEEWKKR